MVQWTTKTAGLGRLAGEVDSTNTWGVAAYGQDYRSVPA